MGIEKVSGTRKNAILLYLALIAAGLAGNYFKFPIFFNIDFVFGSIFAMLALQFFGLGLGIVAAAVIVGPIWFLWHNPYAIMIMTAEVAVVGWLMERRKVGMVLADTLFWLFIGIPLFYLFIQLVMHVPQSNTYMIISKQAINGIANALVARLIFTGFSLRSRSSLMSYREIIYNLLAFFVLCPALIMLAVDSRTDFSETDRSIRTTLVQDCRRVTNRVETWLLNRKSAIFNLAEMAATRSPQQMQPYLELAMKSDINFLRIGLHDKEAITVAYFPLIDELGKNTIGRSFADRPFIPILRQTLQPMLSDVAMSRTGIPMPRVAVLAPVVMKGTYRGYVIGVLGLEQIRKHLARSTDVSTSLYTLLDKNGNVIMTNRTDQTVMKPFVRGQGILNQINTGISQWVPAQPPHVSSTERWGKSFYVTETTIGDLAEWKLIMEQPMAPFQKKLYNDYAGKLTLLFLILLGALALAELLSRKIVAALEQLRILTDELPVRLTTGDTEIAWPGSGIEEANHLITNFRKMAASLSGLFSEIRQINKSLEMRVEKRTEELVRVTEDLRKDIYERKRAEEETRELLLMLESVPSGILVHDAEGNFLFANQRAFDMHGYGRDEFMALNLRRITVPASEKRIAERIEEILDRGEAAFEVEHLKKNGTILPLWINVKKATWGGKSVFLSVETDITERKQAEEERKNLEERLNRVEKMESTGS